MTKVIDWIPDPDPTDTSCPSSAKRSLSFPPFEVCMCPDCEMGSETDDRPPLPRRWTVDEVFAGLMDRSA